MDPEEVTTVVGSILGNLFQVEDGWAHFDEHYANEEGECSKVQFNGIIEALVNGILDEDEDAVDTVWSVLDSVDGTDRIFSSDNEEHVKGYIKKCLKKVPKFVPIFSNALFRFFDVDGSGAISKEEMCMAFGSMVGGENGGPNKKILVDSIFRIVDENQNGSIEAIEVQPFMTEVITAMAKLFMALFAELEEDLKGGLKKKVLNIFNETFSEMCEEAQSEGVGDGSASLDHDALKAKWVEAFKEIKESASESESMVEELSEGASMVPAGIFKKWDLFLDTFRAKVAESGSDSLPIKEVATLMQKAFVPAITAFATPANIELGIPMVASMAADDEMTEFVEAMGNMGVIGDLTNTISGVANSYFKGGGMKRFCEAILNFMDFNNDGDLSVAELTTLYDAGKGMHAILLKTDISGEQKIDDVLSYCGIILSQMLVMFDSDGDKKITPEDFPKLYDKFLELFMSLFNMQIEAVKTLLVALVLPGLNIAFGMCTDDGTISKEMLEGIIATME